MNGQRNRANNFLLDGTDNNDQFTAGRVAVNPNVDMIQEFRVSSNNFSAEFGRNSASVVNVVTKQGSNRVHGTAYEFFRNDALDAKTVFATMKRSAHVQPVRRDDRRPDSPRPDVLLRFGYEGLRLRPRRHAGADGRDAGAPAAGRAALPELDRQLPVPELPVADPDEQHSRHRAARCGTGQRQLAQYAGPRGQPDYALTAGDAVSQRAAGNARRHSGHRHHQYWHERDRRRRPVQPPDRSRADVDRCV